MADVEAWLPGLSYRGDGSLYVKADFGEDGQIDFIAAPTVTDHEPLKRTIQGRRLLLEAVPGIIASKVHYRGSHLKVRDIFDIAAACEAGHRATIRETLAAMPEATAVALQRLRQLPAGRLADLMPREDVRPGFEYLLEEAPAIAREVLTLQPVLSVEANETASEADDEPDSGRGCEPF